MSYYVCGIYDTRPESCRRYPQRDSYRFDCCGYYFKADERKGSCYLDCQASCCMEPRKDGEPGGVGLQEVLGGMPCKHLVLVDTPPEGTVVERPTS